MKIDLEIKGFDNLAELLSEKNFKRRLRYHVKKATGLNVIAGADQVKKDIYGNKFLADSSLTIAIKGSSRPLVDTGALVGSLIGRTLAWNIGEIGVLRRGPHTNNIAVILHFGAKVPVTDKMRRYFHWLASKNPSVKPLKKTTVVIVIPPRPFMQSALTPAIQLEYRKNWEKAVIAALRGGKK
jgi:hypothetical protein